MTNSSLGEDGGSLHEVASSLGEASAAHKQRPAMTRYVHMYAVYSSLDEDDSSLYKVVSSHVNLVLLHH